MQAVQGQQAAARLFATDGDLKSRRQWILYICSVAITLKCHSRRGEQSLTVQAAVEREDYAEAKRLKTDVDKLRSAGELAAFGPGRSPCGHPAGAHSGSTPGPQPGFAGPNMQSPGMIPGSQRNPDDIFNRALGKRGTPQSAAGHQPDPSPGTSGYKVHDQSQLQQQLSCRALHHQSSATDQAYHSDQVASRHNSWGQPEGSAHHSQDAIHAQHYSSRGGSQRDSSGAHVGADQRHSSAAYGSGPANPIEEAPVGRAPDEKALDELGPDSVPAPAGSITNDVQSQLRSASPDVQPPPGASRFSIAGLLS